MKEVRCRVETKSVAVVCGLAVGGAIVIGLAGKAQALPSFARQYKVECATCHTHFPERNAFGEAFERNSFIWPSNKLPKADKGNEAIMLSGIPAEVPISLYARVSSTYNSENTDDGKGPKFDFGNGGSFEFFAAGNFKERVGYLADAGFDTDGANTGNVWLAFKDPANIPLDIKFGTFAPTMSVLSLTRHTAAQGYAFQNSTGIAPTGVSITSSQPAVELSKIFGSQVYGALGLQNNKNNDNKTNNSVAGYGSLSWRIIGTDLHGNQPQVSLSAAESFTDYLTLTLGGWGITGSQHESITAAVDDNEYDRYGVDMEAYYKAWRLRMTAAWGTEENPMLSAPVAASASLNPDGTVKLTPAKAATFLGSDLDLHSYHALLEYMINSDWLVGAAYNRLDIDEVKATVFNYPQDNIALSASYLFYQNVRLQAAYIHDSFQPASGATNIEDGNRDRVTFTAFFSM